MRKNTTWSLLAGLAVFSVLPACTAQDSATTESAPHVDRQGETQTGMSNTMETGTPAAPTAQPSQAPGQAGGRQFGPEREENPNTRPAETMGSASGVTD